MMQPLLIDLDGVLRIDGKLASGAKEFIQEIQNRKIPACILSNTTQLPVSTIEEFFNRYEVSLGEIKIHTALVATLEYVKEQYKSIFVYCNPSSINTFDSIPQSQMPEAIVIGDLGKDWNYELMNSMFNQVMRGADIIAMQMNKFQKTKGDLSLDAGAFITGLEYATGKKAILIGKPSGLFFKTALKKLGFSDNAEFIMIGDDLYSDIKAAQDAGGKGILILTGKTNKEMLSKSNVKPDGVVTNLDEALQVLISNI